MKRIIALFTLIFVLASFAACGGKAENGTETRGTKATAESGILPNFTDNTRETVAEPATEPTNANAAQGNSTAEKKTADEAKGIAFTHAGVSEADVRDLEVDLDRDDGRESYEIDFKVERMEYSYDIDAYTGEILKSEKEMN